MEGDGLGWHDRASLSDSCLNGMRRLHYNQRLARHGPLAERRELQWKIV